MNQGTNTVTVYRVLQVSEDEIPFSEGFHTIVATAEKKADRMAERAEEEAAAENSGTDDSATEDADSATEDADGAQNAKDGTAADTGVQPSENSQERPVRGYFRHIVLRQFRQTDAPPKPTVAVYIPVFACPCSVGANNGTPDGTFTLQDHLRWHELVGPTWGQWCCHFAPSLLFHSLPYDRPNDPNSLQEGVYNQIGTSASHGCVRLVAVDAKYIYDHIPSGTKIEIFTGSAEQDPLGTPERPYIGEWNGTYDPTDPEFKPES